MDEKDETCAFLGIESESDATNHAMAMFGATLSAKRVFRPGFTYIDALKAIYKSDFTTGQKLYIAYKLGSLESETQIAISEAMDRLSMRIRGDRKDTPEETSRRDNAARKIFEDIFGRSVEEHGSESLPEYQ